MDIVCTAQKQEILRSNVTERASQRIFFGVSALLFVASAVLTIHWCTGMSMGEMPMPGGWTMSMTWMRMCGQTWLDAASSFLAMWMAMMVAMMLPSLAPVLWRFYQGIGQTINDVNKTRECLVRHAREGGHPVRKISYWMPAFAGMTVKVSQNIQIDCAASPIRLTLIVGLGYFFVWTLLGLAVYPIGVALTTIEMRSPMLASVVPLAAGVIVLVAGALQFTMWKSKRLDCCRAMPRCHLLPTDIVTAWRYGLRLGFQCSCCCAGLTAVLLVIGVMDLRAMAVVTVAITIERLAPTSAARIIGVVVIAAGLLMLGRAAAWV